MTLPLLSIIVGTLGVSFFVVFWKNGLERRRWNTPPGPKKLPLIGNLLDMPTKLEWETYAQWGKEYDSDIIHVSALGTSIVVLNSYAVASEILDKRSAIYSSRPHSVMFHELSGMSFIFGMLPYGDVWRTSRRIFTKHFSPSNTNVNQPREILYVRRFLGQLLQKPDDFLQRIRTLVSSTALSMIYSIDVRPYDDPYVKIAEEANKHVADLLVAGAFLVDFLPILKYIPKWFPGANFQRKAADLRRHADRARQTTFAATEKLMATGNGEYNPSLVTEALREFEHSEASSQAIELLKDIAAQAYLAGADTSISALGTFFLMMVCYPKVQKKAQAELDKVLDGRLPEHSDIPSLPYISALVKEVFRWQLVLPLGLPHQSTADDIYNDYHIPAGSVVVANGWAMSNDERDYPEPREFKPERFLKNGKSDDSVRNPMDIAFGFGRRVCPGKHLAQSLLTLTAASVLSTFELLKKRDEDGKEIEPKREYKFASVTQPLGFPCVIKPRSRYAQELIRSSSGLE